METEPNREFYVRYFVGHKGKYGHEFLEFELRDDGRLRYANNSNYKNDSIIRKETYVSKAVMEEVQRIIESSEIEKEDYKNWPKPDKVGVQELEFSFNGKEVYIQTAKIGSLQDAVSSTDPEGTKEFYYLIQDLKCFIMSLISIHFRTKPV
eukprot:GDKJ01010679.1.p1 GENE.GDKJ01010679.1~~GDKJ01010679.1.p1  ORF type:complete len:151 (+),score=23.85 GDKJ01010679.1:16-468(+)